MPDVAKLQIDDRVIDIPIQTGSEMETALDISRLGTVIW